MSDLPKGTVAFLFTDLEGSTRLWRLYAEVMPSAYARHDALLRAAIAAHHGVLYKIVGDGCQAAFATAPAALAAAVDAQRALYAEAWPIPEPLRVRMALHVAPAQPGPEGDYRTPELNRAGRLLAAGHGGQVLLSASVATLVRNALPDGVVLRDLGERRMRDLPPERVYQAVASGLPGAFPPIRTPDARPSNLPVPPTALIGRDQDLGVAVGLLRHGGTSLLTLTGTGGTGKSRLALAIAADMIDDFADGVVFVPLTPITDPALVSSAIARALGVQEEMGRHLAESIADHLRDKELLLLLDNFEQVMEASPQVAGLLAACPRLKILVTSREALRLRAERSLPVAPLALPEPDRQMMTGVATRYAAVQLFVERATSVRPDFAVTDANAPLLAQICRRLDGLPLAIELAAAWVRSLSPEEMLARLEQRLPLLTEGPRDAPLRHQTLRATIAWSFDLLSGPQRMLFRRLAVFAGGATQEATEAVVNPVHDTDIVVGLASLVDKSLLVQQANGGATRYVMLETVREFGEEQLHQQGEAEAFRGTHAAWFHNFTQEVAPLTWGADQALWLDRLDADIDNVRGAIDWAIAHDEAQTALDMGVSLERYWDTRGFLGEGRRWLERGLELSMDNVRPGTQAQAHSNAGSLAQAQGDLDGARALQEKALAIIRDVDTEGGRRGMAHTLNRLGIIAFLQGDHDQANTLQEEALARFRDLGDDAAMASVLNNLGVTADDRDDYERARGLYEEALALVREAGDMQSVALFLGNLGEVALSQGDLAGSAGYYQEALGLWAQLKDRWNLAATLHGVAGLASANEQWEPAARLLGTTLATLEAVGVLMPANEQRDFERLIATARERLGEEAFGACWAAGQALPFEHAVAEARAVAIQAGSSAG